MATFEKETVFSLEDVIEYTQGGVISKQITKSKAGNITLFSFDKEKGLSEHTEITINGNLYHLKKGESIIMPANIPHSLKATERFKMLLTMIKNE